MSEKTCILDLDYQELSALLKSQGFPAYRTKQVWSGLYQSLWASPDEFTNLPKKLTRFLDDNLSFECLQPVNRLISKDKQTQKILFSGNNGAAVETVLMQYKKRRTVCISTQSGCAIGCKFCATGQMGFNRNLSSGEIITQVLYYARIQKEHQKMLTNIVIMGMGEPFLNYQATLNAVDRLNQPNGFNFGARRFTISTVGIIPGIEKFTSENRQVNLAISLHAADDALRSSLIPINRKYPIEPLIQTCKSYIDHTKRRLTFEWALIEGINDTTAQAVQLVRLIKKLRLVHVNLIPLNPTTKFREKGSPRERANAFAAILEENKIPVTIRMRRGIEISAGCGQLASKQNPASPSFHFKGNTND